MRKILITFLLAFLLGTSFSSTFLKTQKSISYHEEINSESVFEKVQMFRYHAGLDPYKESKSLCSLADIRLKEIQKNFSHDLFYSEVKNFYGNNEYHVAENLAKGFNTPDEVITAWLNSPTHKKNLVADYAYSCIKEQNGFIVNLFSDTDLKVQ